MVNPQGTSFIPQRPTRGKAEPKRVRKIYMLTYVTYVLFFGSLIATAGVFFFSFSLDVQLDTKRESLAAERQQFNQGDIESIRDLEKRINVAEERLNNHISVLAVFEALEQSAVQSLRYISFTYKRLNDEFPLVTFTGTSDRFNNVLFQRQVLDTNPILAGSVIKDIRLESKVSGDTSNAQELVTFELEKEVDTSLIGYTPRPLGMPEPQQQTQSQQGDQSLQAQGDQQASADQESASEGASDVQQ